MHESDFCVVLGGATRTGSTTSMPAHPADAGCASVVSFLSRGDGAVSPGSPHPAVSRSVAGLATHGPRPFCAGAVHRRYHGRAASHVAPFPARPTGARHGGGAYCVEHMAIYAGQSQRLSGPTTRPDPPALGTARLMYKRDRGRKVAYRWRNVQPMMTAPHSRSSPRSATSRTRRPR